MLNISIASNETGHFLTLRYDDEPYARPEGHLGFVPDSQGYIQDGHQVDPYGRAIDPYGPEYGGYLNGEPDEYPYHTDYSGYR